MTSLTTASPRRSRATLTGIGPRPAISQISSPSTCPRAQRGMVDADDAERLQRRRRRLLVRAFAGGAAGQLDQRVERVRLHRLASACLVRSLEEIVDDRFEHLLE